jgi:hypothetical protein
MKITLSQASFNTLEILSLTAKIPIDVVVGPGFVTG